MYVCIYVCVCVCIYKYVCMSQGCKIRSVENKLSVYVCVCVCVCIQHTL